MRVHGDIPLGEAWGYLRDHARGTTPYAEDQLALCREFQPPSKAHLKRLKRLRLAVYPARPKPKPDQSARLAINEAMSYGKQMEALSRRVCWEEKERNTVSL